MDLLKQVKDRINVTWDYEDEKISEIIEEGKDFILSRVGEVDFDTSIVGRKLIKEYTMYAWNGAVASFEDDFKSDILNLQIRNALR